MQAQCMSFAIVNNNKIQNRDKNGKVNSTTIILIFIQLNNEDLDKS